MRKQTEEFNISKYDRLVKTDWAHPKIIRSDNFRELTIISRKSGNHNYPLLMSDKEIYSINGKHQGGKKLLLVYDKKVPIISGRIVYDKTFALRLRNFIERTQTNDCMSEEEKNYMLLVANELLDYQIETATDEHEIRYLKNNNLL